MRQIDYKRREVEHGKDNAKKIKRLVTLFFIADSLILIKLIYNMVFGGFFDRPIFFVFWIVLLAIAALISIYLIIRLWLYESAKKKELKIIEQTKRDQMKAEKNRSFDYDD